MKRFLPSTVLVLSVISILAVANLASAQPRNAFPEAGLPATENYVTPVTASGNSMSPINNVNDLTRRLAGIGNVIIYLLVGLAVIFIVWHIVMYIVAGSKPEEKKMHLANVGWGILGLFIIVSLWGLVNILVNSFRTNSGTTPNIPSADFINKK